MVDPLLIRVLGHELTGSKRVLFLIKVTKGLNTITIKRRTKDFHQLQKQLASLFARASLPTLPAKEIIRSLDKDYVSRKTMALSAYLTCLQNNAAVLAVS